MDEAAKVLMIIFWALKLEQEIRNENKEMKGKERKKVSENSFCLLVKVEI